MKKVYDQKSSIMLSSSLEYYNLWQFGDWLSLAKIKTTKNEEKLLLKACGQIQIGEIEQARSILKNLTTISNEQVVRFLISGVFNTLAKGDAILRNNVEAERKFQKSIGITQNISSNKHIIQARKNEQLAQLDKFRRWVSVSNLDKKSNNQKLFIDCGGHDGCSVIKFKLMNPSYDIITFEGNPELWSYYENLPTQLIKKLVSDHNGEIEFIIDPVDADGSSIVKEKNIDFYKKVKNEDCPIIISACQDLSEFIEYQAQHYNEIILKLDVEGAEYNILEKMYQDDTLKHITKLYVEFHWNKINMLKEKHDALVEKISPFFEIEEWDAAEFQVHKKNISNKKIRQQILTSIN